MELSPAQRKLAFAGIVVVLVVLGFYFILPGHHAGRSAPAATGPPARVSPTPAAASPTPQPGDTGFDVYRLLPFDRTQLARAAATAQDFTAAYVTYRYDEDPAVYLARLQALADTGLRSQLSRNATAPAASDQMRRDQVVSSGTATVSRIRSFGDHSVIFVVTAFQRITSRQGVKNQSTQYAVTLVSVPGGWRVYDFQPAAAGNAGDVS